MIKYDEQFKLKLVRHYLAGKLGYREVAGIHGIEHSILRHWVLSYKEHGQAGLVNKFVRYDAAFKQKVLERIDRDGLSDLQAAVLYDIRSSNTIRTWRDQYDAGGVGALAPQPKSRCKMPHKYPPAPVSKDMTVEQMQEELTYLRAENAYLKKLKALIQAEKTEALVKKRKWSKD